MRLALFARAPGLPWLNALDIRVSDPEPVYMHNARGDCS